MHTTTAQKKAIDHYYEELAAYHEKKVTHETAVRRAFQNLLSIFAQSANWMLILEQTLANGKRPDGTLRDSFNLPRGYWEAKDTKDDLNTEIRKKISIGYPTTNTIFEDTRRAILYQNNKPVLEVDLTKPKELTTVLDSFFHYAEPDIATFEHAVDDFQESIPDLAQGLLERIKEEHTKNKAFIAAFSIFMEQCRTSLDPNMSRETVDEMLVQHLLTERLFRTIFDNQDFTRRNVIAAEIEKVIQALTSRAFDRNEFARKLDRFYIAIENAAKNLYDWSEKQHFLNTVYERFFQGFSKKQADTHGIVYTLQEIVALRRLDRDAKEEQSRCERMEKAFADYREQLNRPFEHEERLRERCVRQQEINLLLDLDKGDTQVVANDNVLHDEQAAVTFVERLTTRRTGRGQVNDLEGVA